MQLRRVSDNRQEVGECSVEDCHRPKASKGFCDCHYRRWRRTGDPGPADIRVPAPREGECAVDGCDRVVYARKLCSPHYQRRLNHGSETAGRPVLPAAECDGVNRRCRRCREVKPVSAYEVLKNATRYICIECDASARLKRTYGIDAGQYDAILESQGGVCAICEEPPGGDGRFRRLSVDHDHACCSGKKSCGKCVRGLLCRPCNFGIAGFRDRIELLRQAEIYLSKGVTS